MGLFDQLFKKESVVYEEDDIVAVADARIVPNYQISDVMFAEEMLGQTLAFELKNGTIVSPANGTLEVKVIYEAEKAEHFNKTVTVYYNTKDYPLRLTVKGTAR